MNVKNKYKIQFFFHTQKSLHHALTSKWYNNPKRLNVPQMIRRNEKNLKDPTTIKENKRIKSLSKEIHKDQIYTYNQYYDQMNPIYFKHKNHS